jgi:hypothetical protein
MPLRTYRLKRPTIALAEDRGRRTLIRMPSEATLTVSSGSLTNSGDIVANWDGRSVTLFAVDLHERCEEVLRSEPRP